MKGISATTDDVPDTIACDTTRQIIEVPSGATGGDSSSPYLAAAEVVGINGLIMTYNWLFRPDEGFSHVTINTIQRNLTHKHWWWDMDYFRTNTLEHPLHGSFFYSAARSNGMTIAESSLYTAAGSWMWEFIGESEMPSINDMAYTIAGGITIGEPLHRISNHVLDNSKRGIERVGREVLATILNPVQGINRLLRGDMWKVRHVESHLSSRHTPLFSDISLGYRSLSAHGLQRINTACLSWHTQYGDWAGENHGAFDYFDLSVTAAIGNQQSLISKALIDVQLYSYPLTDKPQNKVVVGLYNHFDYHCALPNKGTEEERERHPLVYSEVAAIGPSVAYRLGNRTRFEQQLSLSAIPMGAVPITDVSHSDSRGYSFGSGYGARLNTRLTIREWLHLHGDSQMSQLFTWDGFYDDSGHRHTGEASIQGERGNTVTVILSPTIELCPFHHWSIQWGGNYFHHHFNHRYHPHRSLRAWEWQTGVSWWF